MKLNKTLLVILLNTLLSDSVLAQDGYGSQLIFGRDASPNPSGTVLSFTNNTLQVLPINKPMELEASCAIICDSVGKLLFYSNGCYIANANHQVMQNGFGIGKNMLETSFCNTGGNPDNQGLIALPMPGNDSLYYLFYSDIGNPYSGQPFFPLAPETLYYSVIDMTRNNGLGGVIQKNVVLLQDTLARGKIQAARHENDVDWWIIYPESHSNCYWTFLLTANGIDTTFKQCIGPIWGDRDPSGQAVFSPNNQKYARFNFFYRLTIFDFDNTNGMLYNPNLSEFGLDTFYNCGTAFSSNSRFLYAMAFNKLWQFDTWAVDVSASRILVGELDTPLGISNTRFNQATLAADGKIYIAGTNTHTHLHVIHKPNCYGLECSLEQYAIELYAGNKYTMPNLPHFKKWSDSDTCQVSSAQQPTGQNTIQILKVYPNPTSHNLAFEGVEFGDCLQFFDISGRTVKSVVYQGNSLDISELVRGFYIIKLTRKSENIGLLKVVKE